MHTQSNQPASSEQVLTLDAGFIHLSSSAGEYANPQAIPDDATYQSANVPGTVSMHETEPQRLAELDAYDHWYRGTFKAPTANQVLLQFEGLLTYADVFLNGERILQSFNAFHTHRINITQILQAQNQLDICFRAIRPFLNSKHPRPRYITRLMNERHLRFIRTPVLGYTPGFSAPTKLVGPYRPIKLIGINMVEVLQTQIQTVLLDDGIGELNANISFKCLSTAPSLATLSLLDAESQQIVLQAPLTLNLQNDLYTASLITLIPTVEAYWPHTHGQPKRYSIQLCIHYQQEKILIDLGLYGFKHIERMAGNYFGLNINGASVYLRGASWTPINPTTLVTSHMQMRQRLTMLRDFGFNLLRISGNMLYESDDFYAICDELGIFVYQEFAFSNFDYPDTDADFLQSIEKEIHDFLSKHGNRPCLILLGGGSEVAQQASMMGLDIHNINNPIFTEHLPRWVQQHCPQVPYVVSSPYSSSGLPFHTGDGPCHFFAVGGYRRGFEDARLFKGRFISECLPFSHIPEDESLRQFWNGEIIPNHHPLWKDGVTRDPGSGWDFSDITDFYTEKLFGIDTVKIRSVDNERYLQYCRAGLVESVETTLSILRADSSQSRAVAIWLLHDFKPGAGWGYIDILGKPKSAFYALARTAQPTTVLFVDEGLDGLAIYLTNDAAQAINSKLVLTLVTAEGHIFEQSTTQITLNPRSVNRHSVDTLIGHFVDSSYAYQFGARAFVACVAQLLNENNTLITQKVYAHPSLTHATHLQLGLSAELSPIGEGEYSLTIQSQYPAYYVAIEVSQFQVSNNYFHVMPGFATTIILKQTGATESPAVKIRALNSSSYGKVNHLNK